MANLSVQPANSDPLNLQGGAPTVPPVPSVQPAATGNILQPAGPTAAPATTIPQNTQTTTPAVVAPAANPAPAATSTPAQNSGQTFSFGNGTTFDQNGNPVQSNNANDQIATAAGTAGLSVNDYLSLIGSQTATSAATKQQIEQNLGIPAASTAAFALPQQSTVDFYNEAYNQSGLADLKQQILDLNQKIADTTQQYNTAVGTENENPFLSEAARVGRTANLYNTAQATIANLVNQQNNLQGIYANGVNEVNNAVTRHTNDFTTNNAQNNAKLTYLTQQAEKQQTAQQNTDTAAMVARYAPEYAQSAATAKTPATINAPNGETLQYNKQTGKFEQLTPPVGSYTPYTNTITGQTGVLNQQTGAITTSGSTPTSTGTGTITPDSGAPTITIPQTSPSQPGQTQLAYANNNPGNLQYAGQPGAVQGAGGFAKFATPQAGYQALVNQVALDSSRGLTLGQYITKYAPPSSNNTAEYIANASAALGVSADTRLNQIDPTKVAAFQAQQESGTTVQAAAPAAGNQPIAVQNTPAGQGNLDPVQVGQVQQAFQNLASRFTNADQRTYAQYTLNTYLQKGDIQGAWDYLKTQAVNSLDPTQQDSYNGASNGVASFQQALSVLSNHPELQTGPYDQLINSAKPWLGQNANQDYTAFNQAMQYGTTLIRHGFFGARLTDTEVALSQSFLPDSKDPAATVTNKLKGSIGFFTYVNDKILAQKLGTPTPDLNQYLTAAGYQQ